MALYFCLILIKIGTGRQILVTFSNMKFNHNSLRYSPVASCAQTERTKERKKGREKRRRHRGNNFDRHSWETRMGGEGGGRMPLLMWLREKTERGRHS